MRIPFHSPSTGAAPDMSGIDIYGSSFVVFCIDVDSDDDDDDDNNDEKEDDGKVDIILFL